MQRQVRAVGAPAQHDPVLAERPADQVDVAGVVVVVEGVQIDAAVEEFAPASRQGVALLLRVGHVGEGLAVEGVAGQHRVTGAHAALVEQDHLATLEGEQLPRHRLGQHGLHHDLTGTADKDQDRFLARVLVDQGGDRQGERRTIGIVVVQGGR